MFNKTPPGGSLGKEMRVGMYRKYSEHKRMGWKVA